MRIAGWEVDRFGALQASAATAVPDGLTVIYGANEAGKSTLLEFLRAMLFGVVSGDGNGRYAPANGAPFGGRVRIVDRDGHYVVARDLGGRGAALVTMPDGSAGSLDDLAHLLGGADAKLFRAVFSVTLDDLHSLAALDTDGIREALFSASLVGAGRSARTALETLAAQTAARLEGDAPRRVTGLIGALNALGPRLAAARRRALGYPQRRQALESAAAAAAESRAQLAMHAESRARAAAVLQAWPLWEALRAARAEVAALGAVAMPPEGLEDEVRAARECLLAAGGACDALAGECAAAEAQLAVLPAGDGAVRIAEDLEALSAGAALYRFQLGGVAVAQARATEAAAACAERLRRCGEEWDDAAIGEWGRLGGERDRVREWQARLQASADEAAQAQLRAAAAAEQAESIERFAAAIRTELLARAPRADEVAARRQRLAHVREALASMLEQRGLGERLAQEAREREEALRALDRRGAEGPPTWLAPALAIAALFALAWAVWSGAPPIAAPAVIAAIGVLLAIRWSGVARARAHERDVARRALRSDLEAARHGRDQAWRTAAELSDALGTDAEALGLPRLPGPAELEACAEELAREEAACDRQAAVQARLAELEPLRRAAAENAATRREDQLASERARAALASEWRAWAVYAGLGEDVEPAAALERVAVLQSAHDALTARDAAERELRQLVGLLAPWEERARAVLERAGEESAALAGDALVERVAAVRARAQVQVAQQLRRAALIAELDDRRARLETARGARQRAEAALAAVLERAGVADERELADRRERALRRRELERVVAERERLLAERAGWQGAADAFGDGQAAGEARLAALVAEVPELERHVSLAEAAWSAAAAACQELEGAEDVPTLEMEWAALTAELDEAVRDWRLLAAATGFIEEARANFEHTRQPAVLRAASQILQAVTGGRYERVAQDAEGRALVVIERTGAIKQPGAELSRGTAEQLYLAVRLGLAAELARRGPALPVVMDDVLVNFDAERATAMARVLGDFARQQQVLYLTCHEWMRDLLVTAGKAAQVVEL